MSTVVIGLALFAAILHAAWNAFLRNGGDRLWTVTVMSFASTVFALPFLVFFPLPASGAWPYIVGFAPAKVTTNWYSATPTDVMDIAGLNAFQSKVPDTVHSDLDSLQDAVTLPGRAR